MTSVQALAEVFEKRIALHYARRELEDAFEASCYNRWEVIEIIIREIEEIAQDCGISRANFGEVAN